LHFFCKCHTDTRITGFISNRLYIIYLLFEKVSRDEDDADTLYKINIEFVKSIVYGLHIALYRITALQTLFW